MAFTDAFLFMLGAAAAAQAPSTEAEIGRAKWERGQQLELEFRTNLFVEHGFVPIQEMLDGKRRIRRLIVRDPYGMLFMPGVEIEQMDSRQVRVRLQYWDWRTEWTPMDAAVWRDLASLEAKAFTRPTYVQGLRRTSPCHEWSAYIQSSDSGIAAWTRCTADTNAETLEYAVRIANALMETRPDCERQTDHPLSAFQRCFGFKDKLTDPEFQSEYEALSKEFFTDRSNILLQARLALRETSLTPGSPEWRSAREKVRLVVANHRRREHLVFELSKLGSRARNASAADQSVLKSAYKHWRSTQDAQARNVIELMRDLGWSDSAQAERP